MSADIAELRERLLALLMDTGAGIWDETTVNESIRQALAEYGRIGARAFGEVENALSAEFTLGERESLLKQAVADNTRALELAEVRYRVGSGDLRAVQQQSLALNAARTTLLRVQSERLVQRVNLHLALGGSFGDRPTAAAGAQASQ